MHFKEKNVTSTDAIANSIADIKDLELIRDFTRVSGVTFRTVCTSSGIDSRKTVVVVSKQGKNTTTLFTGTALYTALIHM